jgi:hypothetical protein
MDTEYIKNRTQKQLPTYDHCHLCEFIGKLDTQVHAHLSRCIFNQPEVEQEGHEVQHWYLQGQAAATHIEEFCYNIYNAFSPPAATDAAAII